MNLTPEDLASLLTVWLQRQQPVHTATSKGFTVTNPDGSTTPITNASGVQASRTGVSAR